MSFFQEFGTAVLLVIATLGLQCAGIAALILWVLALVRSIKKLGIRAKQHTRSFYLSPLIPIRIASGSFDSFNSFSVDSFDFELAFH